ncbi:Lysine-specific demethylase 4 [Cladobotryum mycophilum]|uniref:Lysine-specific demethylase 4 n=1 Tax=Cladobotryum mycophilum TaxID=491253 RepID=A0ABR0SRN3_9HYPO
MEEADPSPLDTHAFQLRQLIGSINLEDFALYIIPGDTTAADIFLSSLHNIHFNIEWWASTQSELSLGQSPSFWLPGASPAQSSESQWDLALLCDQETISQQSPINPQLPTPQTTHSPSRNTQFTLDISGVKNSLLPYLADLVLNHNFKNILHINNLPNVSWDSISISNEQLTEHHYRGVTYRLQTDKDMGNYVSLFVADDTYEFQRPPDDATDQQPSYETCIGFLESLTTQGSQEASVSYLVGPPLDGRWNDLVDSGECLRSQLPGDIKGITSPYWHFGGRFSGTAFHKEDCNLRSMNLVIYGFKIWLIVDTENTEKFEAWVRSIWGADSEHDDQWLRHLNLILPPSMLVTAGIKFHLVCAGPGDMVITSPNQYHYVVNMTTNLAVAVNFLFPQEPIARKQTFLCKDCGIYPLANQIPNLFPLAAQGVTPDSGRPQKRRRQQESTSLNSDNGEGDKNDAKCAAVIKKLQAQPAGCLVPFCVQSNLPRAKILRLTMAMRGRSAIGQLWKLQENVRNGQRVDLSEALIDRSLNSDIQQMVLDKSITICNGANQQFNLLRRLSTWHFAEAAELSKGAIAMRVSSKVVSQYTGDGVRNRYSKIKYRGDLLHMICGSHRGLLAFIPLQRDDHCGISNPESQYQNSATKRDFKDFEKIYKAKDALTQVLCAIGTSFLDSWGYKDPCEFKYNDWLDKLHCDLSHRTIKAITDQLGEGI